MIEVPVEKIIEVPVEVPVYIEKPIERIVKKPYEVIRENIINRERVIDIRESQIEDYMDMDCEVMDTVVDYETIDKIVE